MTTSAIALRTPAPVSSDREYTLRQLIDREARKRQMERNFPRLAVGVKLWVSADRLPKIRNMGAIDDHLEKMLRKSLKKHGIYICDEEVSIGRFDKDMLPTPVEIVLQWALPVPEKNISDLIQRSTHLGEMIGQFVKSMPNTKERSP